METFEVVLSDGTKMLGTSWLLESPKANFCLITGMQEYSARYQPLAEFLNQHGYSVYVLDALGQGKNAESVERQMIWPVGGFAKNVEGVARMCELAKKNGKPVIQGGHSMGSFITQRRLELYPHASDATILIGSNGGQKGLMTLGFIVASLIVHKKNWEKPNAFLTNLSLGAYSKAVKEAKTPVDWISYDEKNIEAYLADPYCGHPATGGFWKEFLRGLKEVWKTKEMKRIAKDERILIVAGAEDPVGQNGKGLEWLYAKYQKLGLKGTTLKLYPKMRHEIINETGKEEVYADILAFLDKVVG